MNAASCRNFVLSPSREVASKWWPQCSELAPLKEMLQAAVAQRVPIFV